MKILALAAAVLSIAAAVVAQMKGDPIIALLAAAALGCAGATFFASAISRFLKIFVAIFTAELVVFGAAFLAADLGFWPRGLVQLPESLPLTVAMFSILAYGASFIPLVRSMTRIADRYFDSNDIRTTRIWPFPAFQALERNLARAMVVFLVLINQAEVGMLVRLNFFQRDFFNAIQTKNERAFWYQLIFVFMLWAFMYIASVVTEFVVRSTLVIRWREWLTRFYVDHWLDNHTHYRMSLIGYAADNPDQRISEDIYRFIDNGQSGAAYGIYSFSILLISKLTSLVSFAIVLWHLSSQFTLPFTNIVVPGFLFWVALLYAGFGTMITHWIGRPLIRLSFMQQRYEADFRFSLARLREYGEQIALLRGEPSEKVSLGKRFGSIIRNYFEIIGVRKMLIAFTSFFNQISVVIPYIVTGPFYFLGKIELGIMTQTADAFNNVNDALTVVVNYYVYMADFKAVLDRLTSFDAAIEKAKALNVTPGLKSEAVAGAAGLSVGDLTVQLPNGREIVKGVNLQLAGDEQVLLTGPSGSGKSTLFRAVSGIWPFGQGQIKVPEGARVMLLPQKPYIPIGTLRAALTYPSPPDQYDDATLRAALETALLPNLVDELDVDEIWSQRLSGGELQRMAIARALLTKPDWLFLDEATTGMDEAMEAKIYQALVAHLPQTAIISIGHRGTLQQFHTRRLEMQPAGPGTFTALDSAVKAAE